MAGFFQQFLRGAVDGFLGSPNLKDYKHASKTFTTNAYANAPKFKWLFHVYFDINTQFISDSGNIFPSTVNHGLLVKTIDLPKFNIPLQEMNQYNRKRYVQTKITYDPIKITFHDDNANQIRHLWYTYFSYYYNDPNQPNSLNNGPNGITIPDKAATALNTRNIYNPALEDDQRNWGYIGESGQVSSSNSQNLGKKPFFKAIRIYGFNQHNFALYELINPMIDSFGHDTYSYAETTATMENSMTIKYETVKYYDGALNGQNPSSIVQRFAEPSVYDTELSPIARLGTNRSILGQGGLVDSANGILTDLGNNNILGAIQTAGRLSRTFKNSQQILQAAKTELVAGVIGAVSNPQTARSAFNFPALGSTTGVGSQYGNATFNPGAPQSSPTPVPTENNTPVTGSNVPKP